MADLSSAIIQGDGEPRSRTATSSDGYPNPAGGFLGILYPYRKWVVIVGSIVIGVMVVLELVVKR